MIPISSGLDQNPQFAETLSRLICDSSFVRTKSDLICIQKSTSRNRNSDLDRTKLKSQICLYKVRVRPDVIEISIWSGRDRNHDSVLKKPRQDRSSNLVRMKSESRFYPDKFQICPDLDSVRNIYILCPVQLFLSLSFFCEDISPYCSRLIFLSFLSWR